MSTHTTDHAAQGRTLVTANAWGEAWESDDLKFVAATLDERVEDVALAVGRTLYAVWNMRHRLTAEGLDVVLASMHRDRLSVASDPLAFDPDAVCARCFCVHAGDCY